MNEAHLHLILVHIPIVLIPFAALVLALGMYIKKSEFTLVALGAFIIASLFTVAAFSFGEGAEEIVEDLPGIVKSVMETHEEAAEVSLWFTSILGIVSLISLFLIVTKKNTSLILLKLSLILSVITSATLFYTGNLGGKIRHPEAFDSSVVTSSESDDD